MTQRGRVIQESKMIFSIIEESLSWSDADDSPESVSDPEEEDMPDDKDLLHSRVGDGDGDGETREDEDDESSDDFFNAGEGAIIGDQLSLRAASESRQSVGDPSGRLDQATMSDCGTIPRKLTAISFSRSISLDSADLDDEEWVYPTPVPPTPLKHVPPAFPPPFIAKTKSSSSAKSRKRKEARAHVPFPSSMAEGAQEDRPWRIP